MAAGSPDLHVTDLLAAPLFFRPARAAGLIKRYWDCQELLPVLKTPVTKRYTAWDVKLSTIGIKT